MRARARVEVGVDGEGRSHYRVLRSDPPILLRPTPQALLLVGGAAGPLGGDDLQLEIVVDSGARLVIRSAAAALSLPGPTRSRMMVRAWVGDGAHLDLAPEPLVSVAGGDHQQLGRIELGHSAELRWQESVVLGRTGEDPGRLEVGCRVERAGRPLYHQELRVGPKEADGFADFRDPAVLGGHRRWTTELVVGPAHRSEEVTGTESATETETVLDWEARRLETWLEPGVRLTTVLG